MTDTFAQASTPGDNTLSEKTLPAPEKSRLSLCEGFAPTLLLASVSIVSISNSPPLGVLWMAVGASVLVLAGCFLVESRPSVSYAISILLACQYVALLACCPSVRASASLSISLRHLLSLLPILLVMVRPRWIAKFAGFSAIVLVSFFLLLPILLPLALFRFSPLVLAGEAWISGASIVCLTAMLRASMLDSPSRKAIMLYCALGAIAATLRAIGWA